MLLDYRDGAKVLIVEMGFIGCIVERYFRASLFLCILRKHIKRFNLRCMYNRSITTRRKTFTIYHIRVAAVKI